jgi:asparagine synthetase B (glutamine-hydrolysing)
MKADNLPLANYCWLNGALASPADVMDALRSATVPDLRGQFAIHAERNGEHWLVRDPLGVNKLFFALAGDTVLAANYLIDLTARHIPLEEIWSVPSGHHVRLRPQAGEYQLTRYAHWPCNDAPMPEPFDVASHAARIGSGLRSVFESLRDLAAGREVFVTMSGGMDSSTIAVLAREYLGRFTGVTFTVADETGGFRESEDLRFARRLAADIDVPLHVVACTSAEITALLDEVLVYGQDWRDFNVHCGLVNAAIAHSLEALAKREPGAPRPLLLTGDAMNEIMSDYKSVTYGGREYYRLPRLSRAQLRPFLMQGLDSGDREVGLYARHGLDAIQPYAICADAYLSLPGQFLDSEAAKERLVEAVMGERVPAYIRRRPKVRAQAGGSDELRGTLAVLADAGIDSDRLKRRFAELFAAAPGAVERLIKAGYYRFATVLPDRRSNVA